MIFHEKSCDRLCLLDFNEWNCIIFLYGTIKLIIIIIIIIIIIVIVVVVVKNGQLRMVRYNMKNRFEA